jgi:hypothetical protein
MKKEKPGRSIGRVQTANATDIPRANQNQQT